MAIPRQRILEEAPKDGDLINTLYDALKGINTKSSGSFYHFSTDANAPNPGLSIEGLGLIGLPLDEQRAQAIISRAAQAPFGKGTETLVDKTVRDTWEIDPASVSFLNPKWGEYTDQLASQTVWAALGIAPFTTKPRCELHKLLVYQTGSHFLPHQDTLKSNGMFATIIVVLPSAFEGGEVHVSHAGKTKVLDVSPNSAFSTSVLAWYTDVMHEVKPVTSGYRLALSYNLIHTSPNKPQPVLPTADSAQAALRQCLQKWKDDRFSCTTGDQPLTAYLLDHQYSTNDLDRGLEALKGKDANTLSQLLPIAKDLGFTVGIGNCTRRVKGYGDDMGGEYACSKRRKYGPDGVAYEVEDDTPEMVEVDEEDYEVAHFVRIDDPSAIRFKDFSLDRESLVPEDLFGDSAPDETDYEGYQGNEAGTLEHWYRRSVLILYQLKDEIDLAISFNGSKWALEQLKHSHGEKTDQIIVALLQSLGSYGGPGLGVPWAIMESAIARQRVEWCNKALPYCDQAMDTWIGRALDAFELDAIKPGLTQLMERKSDLKARFTVIEAISAKLESGNDEWLNALEKDALSSYRAAATSDIPTFIEVVQKSGAEVLEQSVLPSLSKTGSYEFLVSLVKALNNHCATLEPSEGQEKPAIGSAIRQALLLAIPQWQLMESIPGYHRYYSYGTPAIKADRLPELINLCFDTGHPGLCATLHSALPANTTFLVLFEFAKELEGRVASLPSLAQDAKSNLKAVIYTTLEAAISQWRDGLTLSSSSHWEEAHSSAGPPLSNASTNRICGLIDLCLSLDALNLCIPLLNNLLELLSDEARSEARFKDIYTPLIPQLKGILEKHSQPLMAHPFGPFLKIVTACYLSRVLAPRVPKTLTASLPVARNAGCGHCAECRQLKAFINNAAPEHRFQAHMTIRKHLEAEITKAKISDVVTPQTVKTSSPHTLLLTKDPKLVTQLAWKEAQANVSKFLRSVGGEDELKTLMGESYSDVGMALRGTKVFAMPERLIVSGDSGSMKSVSPTTILEPGVSAQASAATSTHNSATAAAEAVAGRKRKHRDPLTNTIAVIDLT